MKFVRHQHDRLAVAAAPAFLVFGQVSIDPSKENAPGAGGLESVINGIAFYTLLAAAAGFLLGGAMWAVGGRVGNDYVAANGKTGMVVAFGVAFLVGAATTILNFAYTTGGA